MNTIGDVREMDDGREQAKPAPERLALDENKRSPNEGVMEQPNDVGVRARNNGRERNAE